MGLDRQFRMTYQIAFCPQPHSANPVSQASTVYLSAKREPMNDDLIVPNKVSIQLADTSNRPFKMSDVIFRIRLLARFKNDFSLGPFLSDANGLVTVSKKEIEAGVAANYDSGLMDYAPLSNCSPSVEISLYSLVDIQRAIDARSKVWTNLLAGERDRWGSIEQLIDVYRNAPNSRLQIERSPTIRDTWNKDEAEFSYIFAVVPR